MMNKTQQIIMENKVFEKLILEMDFEELLYAFVQIKTKMTKELEDMELSEHYAPFVDMINEYIE